MMNINGQRNRKRWGTLLLAAAMVAAPVVFAREDAPRENVVIVPAGGAADTQPGWLETLSRQPWVKRLAHMWCGEEQDDADLAKDGSLGTFLGLVERGNLFQLFRKGGPIMWPLFCAALLSLGTVLERIGFFTLERFRRNTAEQRKFMTALREGQIGQAVEISRRSRYFVVRVLGYALTHRDAALEGAVQFAKEQELHRYRRGIPILDTVITLAPLLGLLGTVTGMMASFSLIGGELGAPGAITGGIAEALIATAFGLGIAITSLIPFNLMNQSLEAATQEIDEAANAMQMVLAAKGLFTVPVPEDSGEGGVVCSVA